MRGTRASGWPSAGTRARPARDSRSSRRDAAVVPVIEAIIIALIVGGAMLFAVSFQAPPPPAAGAGAAELEERTWDAISTLDGQYYDDRSAANSSLSAAVRDALAGNPENLTAALQAYLPPGAQFNVYLNNGYDQLTVYESRNASGQTVGVAYPFEPRWRTTFTEPALQYYGTAASPTLAMGVTNIPLFNSNLVPGEGHLLEAEAVGKQDWLAGGLSPVLPTVYTETGYATVLQGNADVDYTSISLFMACGDSDGDDGRPCYAMDLTQGASGAYGPNKSLSHDDDGIPIVLENNGVKTLEKGAKVTVELPVGLVVNSTWERDPTHNWTIGYSGVPPNPQTVQARLKEDLATGERAWFQINVTTTDGRYAYKHLNAYVTSPSTSTESDLLLKVTDRAPEAQSGGDTRVMLVSGPQPAGSSSGGATPAGRWGVVLTNPVKSTDLKAINLSLPDQPGIISLGDVPNDVESHYESIYGTRGGIWDVGYGDNHVNMSFFGGDHTLDAWSFAEMQFRIETDGRFTQASPAFPMVRPDTWFTGYTPAAMSHQTDPGVWWEEFPPQVSSLPGYPVSNGTLTGRLDHRNLLIQGQGQYFVEDLQSGGSLITIQDALRAAQVGASDRKVPIGQPTTITVDATDLATVLSSQLPVNDLTLHTNIYAPWGIADRIPETVKRHTADAGLDHRPNDIELDDLDDDGGHDIVAAYSDGNVYGLSGSSGAAIPGMTWSVPNSGEPTLLAKGRNSLGNPFYGVGTGAAHGSVYGLEHPGSAQEKWSSSKHPTKTPATLAVNASLDIDQDGHGDVLIRQPSDAPSTYAGIGMSKLLLISGADGDSGALLPGAWSRADQEGVLIPGRSDQVGMAVLGPKAERGVYSNTAGGVGANVGHDEDQDWQACGSVNLDDPSDCELTSPVTFSVTISVSGSGLMGFYGDGIQAWNYTGGDFVRTITTDKIPTGGAWDGILAGGGEGFLYGLNAEVPINPADGWILPAALANNDLDMANDLEGYISAEDGSLAATRSGMANWVWAYPSGVPRAIGTIQAPYGDPRTEVSYAAGDAGGLWRSTDRLSTLEDISGPGGLLNSVDISLSGGIDLDPSALSTLALSNVDFQDVWVESEDEAYFVGGGKQGTSADGNAYVVHTVDGGAGLLVTEIACETPLGAAISGCSLQGIASNGTALWAVGTHGMVLTQNITGNMTDVSLHADQPDPKVVQDGFVHMNLTNQAKTELKEIQLIWTNETELSHFQELRVDTGAGNKTLWSLSDDATGLYVDGGFDGTKGAGRGAIVDLRSFDDNKDLLGDPDDNIWNGDATLMAGPFVNSTTGGSTIPAASFPAVNLTFVMIYEDGSQDLMTVGVQGAEPTAEVVEDNESPGGMWAAASRTGYTTPECFGPPDENCVTINSINFTINKTSGKAVGVTAGENQEANGATGAKKQWSLYKLDETTTWAPVRNLYPDVTLYDAAIGTHDVDRWAAVGNGSRAFMSFNKGQNWTEMPPIDVKNRQTSNLYNVDLTHPKVGYTVGGGIPGTLGGSFVTLGGYSESGQLVANDIYTDETGQIKEVFPDTSGLEVFVDGGDNAKVEVQVQDPDGTWKTILDSVNGAKASVALSSPTDVLPLRMNLSVDSPWNRYSPQAVGTLELLFRNNTGKQLPSATIDLSDPSHWDSGTSTVEIDTDRSMIRLVPAQVPWLTKLGNYTAADRGARPADIDLSPDGWTAWVGTEGVYEIGGAYQSVPVASDNRLYGFNLSDGSPLDGFEIHGDVQEGFTGSRFNASVQFVRAHENGVYVITGGTTSVTRMFNVSLQAHDYGEVYFVQALQPGDTLLDVELGHITGAKPADDLVLAIYNTITGAGTLDVREGPLLTSLWGGAKSPAVKGFFQFPYTVERNSMFGAYVIQTEFEWTMTTEDDRSITQSARIHNAFTVTPPNRKVALSPTYTLDVVAWMEDWG